MWHTYPRLRLPDGFWQEALQDWYLSSRSTRWRRSRPDSCLRRAGPREATDPRQRRLLCPLPLLQLLDPPRALMRWRRQNRGNHAFGQWRGRCGKERDFEDSIAAWDLLSWASFHMRRLISRSLRLSSSDTCAGRRVSMRGMPAAKKSRWKDPVCLCCWRVEPSVEVWEQQVSTR